jgi:LysM repeat protein
MRITLLAVVLTLCSSGCATSKNSSTSAAPADAADALHRQLSGVRASEENLRQQIACIPNDVLKTYGLYRLSAGDSLGRVARNTGVTAKDLAWWNNIADPSKLAQGWELALDY